MLLKSAELHRFWENSQFVNWRLDNAKSPATMLQEKTARTPGTLRVAGGCQTYVALNARSHAAYTYIPEVG